MPFLPKTSHTFTDESQELLVSMPFVALKLTLEIGAVCPDKMSIN